MVSGLEAHVAASDEVDPRPNSDPLFATKLGPDVVEQEVGQHKYIHCFCAQLGGPIERNAVRTNPSNTQPEGESASPAHSDHHDKAAQEL
mmetsp:Transcript_26116/g.68700  ORF Transcript_26116/g.68700 Transcript_26116/m.68700 type:complete len:90 (+) Transcript_26116:199-468(+)